MATNDGPGPPGPSLVWSCGSCPECRGVGDLLLLRHRTDGALLIHCTTCGLARPHGESRSGGVPRAGAPLDTLAPGGVDAATPAEISAAGLAEFARPLHEGSAREVLEGYARGEIHPLGAVNPYRRTLPWSERHPGPTIVLFVVFVVIVALGSWMVVEAAMVLLRLP